MDSSVMLDCIVAEQLLAGLPCEVVCHVRSFTSPVKPPVRLEIADLASGYLRAHQLPSQGAVL